MNRARLEQFTNWLLQEIACSPTRSVVVKANRVPDRLGLALHEVDEALVSLREQCVIACADGRWWARDPRAHRLPVKIEPPIPELSDVTTLDLPARAQAMAKRKAAR